MHVFLTGEIQIGKSSCIRRYLDEYGGSICGFLTIGVGKKLYMMDVNKRRTMQLQALAFSTEESVLSDTSLVAVRGQRPEIFTEAFDRIGCGLLEAAEKCSLIIMDELGFMESEAYRFQDAVMKCLDGNVPVLGVVRDKRTEFLDRVRQHENVKVIKVTTENREEVFKEIKLLL